MREIKFRAWDKDSNAMIVNSTRKISFKGDVDGGEDLILMQYTGLKDINGKEIYEGDIIGIKTKNKPAYISEVLFKEGEFCYFDLDYTNKHKKNYPLNAISSEEGVDHDGSHICKVVGNIYENPKLLEEIENAKNNQQW